MSISTMANFAILPLYTTTLFKQVNQDLIEVQILSFKVTVSINIHRLVCNYYLQTYWFILMNLEKYTIPSLLKLTYRNTI